MEEMNWGKCQTHHPSCQEREERHAIGRKHRERMGRALFGCFSSTLLSPLALSSFFPPLHLCKAFAPVLLHRYWRQARLNMILTATRCRGCTPLQIPHVKEVESVLFFCGTRIHWLGHINIVTNGHILRTGRKRRVQIKNHSCNSLDVCFQLSEYWNDLLRLPSKLVSNNSHHGGFSGRGCCL